MVCAGKGGQSEREGLKAVVSDAVLPLLPAVLEEEDPMPLYALKLLVVLLDTEPTWATHLQRYAALYTPLLGCLLQEAASLTEYIIMAWIHHMADCTFDRNDYQADDCRQCCTCCLPCDLRPSKPACC